MYWELSKPFFTSKYKSIEDKNIRLLNRSPTMIDDKKVVLKAVICGRCPLHCLRPNNQSNRIHLIVETGFTVQNPVNWARMIYSDKQLFLILLTTS